MAEFLKDYTLLDQIGRGAFASVYKVRHNQLGYIRAVRVLNDTLAKGENDPTWHKFLNECRLLLRLGNGNNPNIVHIYQPLLRECKALVEMDYIDGKDLNNYLKIRNGYVEANEVVRLAREIGGALAYCHHDIYRSCMDRDEDHLQDDPNDGSQVLIDAAKEAELVRKYRVIHNDLHSGNIMRRHDGTFILLDFGLSIQDGDVLHSSKRRGGAPEYKAPEKWDDDGVVTTQSDIFSFGIILYEMLTGHVPFQFQKGVAEVTAEYNLMNAIKSAPLPSIYEARKATYEATHPGYAYEKDYPEWLELLISKCLAKAPEERFESGRELYDFVLTWTSENKTAEQNKHLEALMAQLAQKNQELERLRQGQDDEHTSILPPVHVDKPWSNPPAPPVQPPTPPAPAPSSGSGIAIAIVTVIVIITAGVLFYSYWNSQTKPTDYSEDPVETVGNTSFNDIYKDGDSAAAPAAEEAAPAEAAPAETSVYEEPAAPAELPEVFDGPEIGNEDEYDGADEDGEYY
ncbi:MAG: serine/threonine protein kinase [Muribaculaceae bacterium]|nr:serine/threonine protein kinase [Muribaculaceae bacterium]